MYNNQYMIKFAIALFCENSIHFIYFDPKSFEIKISFIKEKFEPFCPVPENVFFIEMKKLCDQKFFDNLNDKLSNYIQIRSNKISSKNEGTLFSSAIFAGIDSFKNMSKNGFNHLHVFSANKNANGICFFPEPDYIKKYSSENEIKLFLPEINILNKLSEELIKTNVTFNLFICGLNQQNNLEPQINLPTFFNVCSNTGGRGFYYPISAKNEKFNEDIKLYYEKLHYDLNSILNKRYYYDIEIQLKHSNEFEIFDIFYSTGKNNKQIVNIPSINNDFSILYNMKFTKNLKEDKKYSFQFIVSFIDTNDNYTRKFRIYNYSIFSNEIYFKVYSYIDIDTMVKLIFCKEISDSLTEKNRNVCCFEKVKENLKKRLIDALYFYKKNV